MGRSRSHQAPNKHTLLTVETSPRIDPGVAERKYYVTSVGDIKVHTVSGNHEQIKLIGVTHRG